jgi:orotidine-5'-phosphate decarboxylase
MVSFIEKWLAAVDKKGSNLCAGMDPSEYAMGRTEKGEGLPAGADKRRWALDYLEAVAPYVAGFKPNLRYWGSAFDNDLETLNELFGKAEELGVIAIQDSKEADIGSTNDAGIFYAAMRGADAVTIAPYAGNMEEAAQQGKDRKIGLITMCMMSNPDYKKEKNMLVDVSDNSEAYDIKDITTLGGDGIIPYVRRYIQLARDANRFGIDGIVLGAPSSKNHITEEEVANVAKYFRKDGLILVPGIGAQGGEVSMLVKYFKMEQMIANVGRSLMFPKGPNSTPEDQANAAKEYFEMLKNLKKAA